MVRTIETKHKLKPCPFCGSKEIIIRQQDMNMEIVCDLSAGGCGVCMGWYASILQLVKTWNTRVKRVEYDNEKITRSDN